MSAQAVGGAVGHNPISIIIPCHRVIGAKGDLTGYAGGIETLLISLLENYILYSKTFYYLILYYSFSYISKISFVPTIQKERNRNFK